MDPDTTQTYNNLVYFAAWILIWALANTRYKTFGFIVFLRGNYVISQPGNRLGPHLAAQCYCRAPAANQRASEQKASSAAPQGSFHRTSSAKTCAKHINRPLCKNRHLSPDKHLCFLGWFFKERSSLKVSRLRDPEVKPGKYIQQLWRAEGV